MPSFVKKIASSGPARLGLTLAASHFLGPIGGLVVNGVLSRVGAKKPKQEIVPETRLVTVRQSAAARQVIFGECRVGGLMSFAHVDFDKLQLVVTYAGHETAGVVDVWLDHETWLTDDIIIAPGAYSGNGRLKWANALTVYASVGDEGAAQPFPPLPALAPTWQNDTWLQQGCSKIWYSFTFAAAVYPQGVPALSAHWRGALVYDPRTAATGWTNNAALLASHYLSDAEWYCIGADYATEIDEDALIAAANVCDERVATSTSYPTATFTASADYDVIGIEEGKPRPATREGVRVSSSGTLPAPLAADTTYYAIRSTNGNTALATSDANAQAGTFIDITDAGSGTHTLTYYDEPRYTANGSFLADAQPREVLGLLLAAMAGKAVYAGGKWHIFAGAYETPTVELDENDLVGEITVQTLVSRRENANAVRGNFTNPDANWQVDDFLPIESDAYMAEDNDERVWKDIDLSAFVTGQRQAQRLAKIELLSGRQGLTVQATFKLTAWAAMTGRTVALSHTRFGWSSKAFEVQSSAFVFGADGTLAVRMTLRETAAAVYDWATSDEQSGDLAPNTGLPDIGDIEAPGTPAVTEELVEVDTARGVAVQANVSWGASTYAYGPVYQLEWKLSSASTWKVRPLTRDTSDEIRGVQAASYDFRVRAVAVTGALSDYSATRTKTFVGFGAVPAAPTGVSLQASNGRALISLTQHPELDVRNGGRILVRHTEETSSQSWEESFSIGKGESWPGDAVLLNLPLKAGSYLVRAQDILGQESASFVSRVSKQVSVHAFTGLTTVTENSGFTGTHSDTVEQGGKLKLLAPDSYVSLSGAASNDISTPDSAAASITGDIYMICKVRAVDYSPAAVQYMVGKWLTTGDQRSYAFRFQTTGRLLFLYSTDGIAQATDQSTAAVTIGNGVDGYFAMTCDVNDGGGNHVVKFYESTNYDEVENTGTWTQVGATVTTAGTISLFDGTGVLRFGSLSGNTGNLEGRFYYGQIGTGTTLGAAPTAIFNASDAALTGDTSIVSRSTGETYTVNTSGSPGSSLTKDDAVPSSGTYTFATAPDFGSLQRVRVTTKIEGLIASVNELFDAAEGDFDDGLDFDGSSGSACDAWVEQRNSDDNVTFTEWDRVDSAEYYCRYMQFRCQMTSNDSTMNAALSTLQAIVETRT